MEHYPNRPGYRDTDFGGDPDAPEPLTDEQLAEAEARQDDHDDRTMEERRLKLAERRV